MQEQGPSLDGFAVKLTSSRVDEIAAAYVPSFCFKSSLNLSCINMLICNKSKLFSNELEISEGSHVPS